jgi:hypothetical protein
VESRERLRHRLEASLPHAPEATTVEYGSTRGTVNVVAKADDRRASYEWPHRVDGGKT